MSCLYARMHSGMETETVALLPVLRRLEVLVGGQGAAQALSGTYSVYNYTRIVKHGCGKEPAPIVSAPDQITQIWFHIRPMTFPQCCGSGSKGSASFCRIRIQIQMRT